MLILVAVMLLSMNARAQETTDDIWTAEPADCKETTNTPVTTTPKWDTTTTKIVTTAIPYTTTPKTSVMQKLIAHLFFALNKN